MTNALIISIYVDYRPSVFTFTDVIYVPMAIHTRTALSR